MTDHDPFDRCQMPPPDAPRWFSILVTVIFVVAMAGLVAAIQTLMAPVPLMSSDSAAVPTSAGHHDPHPDWRTS